MSCVTCQCVTCHVSHVMCHMSHFTCHVSHVNFFLFFFLTKWWILSVEGLLSMGPTPSSFFERASEALKSTGKSVLSRGWTIIDQSQKFKLNFVQGEHEHFEQLLAIFCNQNCIQIWFWTMGSAKTKKHAVSCVLWLGHFPRFTFNSKALLIEVYLITSETREPFCLKLYLCQKS